MNSPSIKDGQNGYIDSLTPQVSHRRPFIDFTDLAPPITKVSPRKQSRDSWRIPSLNREYEAAVAAFGGYHLRMLAGAGINGEMIHQLPFGKIGFVRAEIRDGFYQPAPTTGSEIYLVPAFDEYGRLIDLVGFHPTLPKVFWMRFGVAALLGDPSSDQLYLDISALIRNGWNGVFRLDQGGGNG